MLSQCPRSAFGQSDHEPIAPSRPFRELRISTQLCNGEESEEESHAKQTSPKATGSAQGTQKR